MAENVKVTIIGAGNVGSTITHLIAEKEIVNEVVLLDIKQGLGEGRALDIWQTSPINGFDTKITGVTDDYSQTANSEIAIITSGIPRRPGMSRDDLISTNAEIVKTVTEKVIQYSPEAKIIVVSNPLDVMTYTAYLAAKTESRRVFGMSGVLDTSRYRAFIAEVIDCSPKDIQAMLLGGHGDNMVPLTRYTTVSGIPVSQLMSKSNLDAIVKRTRNGGGELVSYLGTSAWHAPGAAVAQMVEAIIRNQRRIFPCCAMLNGEYGLKDIYIGVPVKLGKNGIEQIIEIELNSEEKAMFDNSVDAVRSTMQILEELNIK
jgi:malate dehydrogenase